MQEGVGGIGIGSQTQNHATGTIFGGTFGAESSSKGNLFFHFSIISAVMSYVFGVRTHPGSAVATGTENYTEKNLQNNSSLQRWCKKTNSWKPVRAHFDSVNFKTNIHRMDHYCPWFMNTIGLYNCKFFWL